VLPSRAIALVRISDARGNDTAGVDRQEQDARRLADRLGWTIAEIIVENDTSAFKRRAVRLPDGRKAMRVVRPGFRRALAMLESGEADGLIAYDLDRVARDPRDLEDLIDVVESETPRIPVESVSGSLRLANDGDVTMARVLVAVANKSSRDTSRRVTRKHEELAANGRPSGGGQRGYGYEPDGVTIRTDEAAIVQEMAEKVLAGESLYAIADDLETRGVPTVQGGPWTSRSVKSIVTGPRVTGLRRHKGRIVGEAVWPAILPRETWEAVCATLAGRSGGGNQLHRWLTGVLRCGLCGHLLSGWTNTRVQSYRYWCATPQGGCGKIAIDGPKAEAEIERQVIDYLSTPRILEQLRTVTSTTSAERSRQQIAEDEAQLQELAGMWARRSITLGEYTTARKVIENRLRESRAFLSAAAPGILRRLLAGDVAEAWGELGPHDKRDVVLTILPDGYEVAPHPKDKARVFMPERLLPICESRGGGSVWAAVRIGAGDSG
jgi:DNA invertase Pin-like site-specific DNA recombinase